MADMLCQAFKNQQPKACKTLSKVPPTSSLTFQQIRDSDNNIFANNFLIMLLGMLGFGVISILGLYCLCQRWLGAKVLSEMEHTKIAKKYGPYI